MALAAITGVGFAVAGNGSGTPEPKDSDSPTSSAVCAEEVPDCNDTPVIGPDGEGAIEPGFSVGEPYPMPTADKSCGPMAVVAITSEGEVSCLDLAPDTGDDQGQLSPARPPVAEPVR